MKLRKIANWILGIAFLIFIIDWGVMGLKLIENNYDITAEAYIGLACFIIILVSVFVRCFMDKCPYCGKIRVTKGDYCSYCGKKIE